MSVVLVHDGSALTTTTTATVTAFGAGAAFPNTSRPYFLIEQSGLTGAAASNSAIGVQFNYLAPGGNSIVLGTTPASTYATNGIITAITWNAPFGSGVGQLVSSTCAIMPMPAQVQYNFTTAGTACGARVWAVIPNR